MSKLQKNFEFSFPLSHRVVKNLRLVTEHVGDLSIEGVAYLNTNVSTMAHLDERYEVDIDFVKWNGVDIKPVLGAMGQMDDIEEAALHHASTLFSSETKEVA